jgi:Cu(I)/Ag(I) efflux system membrane protein CusA/SilA
MAALIAWSIRYRIVILFATLLLAVWGAVEMQRAPLDAIPDLSETQVIVRTPFPGQSPQVVEDQVTYPITTTLLAVPKAETVRGFSYFGDSFVYVIFDEGTDLYWARSRVLEYLNEASGDLPEGVEPRLGPDATGVGWVYQYALVDRSGERDLSDLRSLQDWFLRFELQALPGVAEVASVGGMVKQYQVVVDPDRLRAFGVSLDAVRRAIIEGNREVGGSVLEQGEAEYLIRGFGYLDSIQAIETVPVGVSDQGTPILIRDLARVRLGPEMRRGVAELDGEGEVVGGIVVMRDGANALAVIEAVEARLAALRTSLPEGVEVVVTYDRSELIRGTVANLQTKLVQEFLVVALVCLLFLFHLRSAVVALVILPLGIAVAFIIMNAQGITANLMALGGIAIAIGAMVDAAIVMIENAHTHRERYHATHGAPPRGEAQWQVIRAATTEVGPALFLSLLIITLSFLPVFALQGQEGRLFAPLAFTKTYAMAAAAGFAVTLTPVLIGYLIRGRSPRAAANPLNRILIGLYRPLLERVLDHPRVTLALAGVVLLSGLIPLAGVGGLLWPARLPVVWVDQAVGGPDEGPTAQAAAALRTASRELNAAWQAGFDGTPLAALGSGLGQEFMPRIDEGDLFYMPTTLPGLSIGKARELLQQTDRLIASVPEVERVFGKVGRAETATDPAPLTMIETMIRLKPKSEWRAGLTLDGLIAELDRTVQVPGLTNAWVQPIKTRIDMISTGIKTPIGLKIAGPELATLDRLGQRLEDVLGAVPGTSSVISDRVTGGRYIEIRPDRVKAARFGLNIGHINTIVGSAVGGVNVTQTVEGRERYPVNIRYPRAHRDDLEALRNLPLVTPTGAHIPLQRIAEIRIAEGPPMIKSENARLNGWVLVDVRDRPIDEYLREARARVAEAVDLPPGYSLTWSGQYQDLDRAQERLAIIGPATLGVIFILLYLAFGRLDQSLLVLASLPLALVGGLWLLWALDFAFSVAVAVGLIALAGVAAEFGVIMLLYINQAVRRRHDAGEALTSASYRAAILEGAVQRIRPKIMTVAVLVAGLLPLFIGHGPGSEVMTRIAAPMIGGMITAPLLSLFVLPAALRLLGPPTDAPRELG